MTNPKLKRMRWPLFIGSYIGSAHENGTKAIQNVGTVNVFQSHNMGTTVEHAGGEYYVERAFPANNTFPKGP